ncbi:hypothetical protein [Algoriphagus antarcticus]|uniref:Uncharacterized protein n=1 Tax=Algoriphagus antarcticus TaxID=238540 RepID=A0A3E0DFY8_9BACT|nr:hypothetical protein [Algoriphagus antarcticus]REG81499.1 hypothetical protein C8N25_1263 [Algoriphagus antarcticus]
MNTKLKKIAKTVAVGIFFMALFFNVKFSLTDPFINIDNAAIAQTTSSSGGGGGVTCPRWPATGNCHTMKTKYENGMICFYCEFTGYEFEYCSI